MGRHRMNATNLKFFLQTWANLDSPKDGPTLSQRANEVEVKLVVGREHDAGVGKLLRVGPEQPRPGLRVRRKVMEEP